MINFIKKYNNIGYLYIFSPELSFIVFNARLKYVIIHFIIPVVLASGQVKSYSVKEFCCKKLFFSILVSLSFIIGIIISLFSFAFICLILFLFGICYVN